MNTLINNWKPVRVDHAYRYNYMNRITFAKATSFPKYVQLLCGMVILGNATREELIKRIWHVDLKSRNHGYQSNPFTLLSGNGFAKYDASKRTWSATKEGMKFLLEVHKKALAEKK